MRPVWLKKLFNIPIVFIIPITECKTQQNLGKREHKKDGVRKYHREHESYGSGF